MFFGFALSDFRSKSGKTAQNAAMPLPHDIASAFFDSLDGPFTGEALFDEIDDTVYFLKDRDGRYAVVNRTLAKRCGLRVKDDLVGRSPAELFPEPIGTQFAEQDRQVIETGRAISAKLELHLYPGGGQGWCLTWKAPLRNRQQEIVGLMGISRDLRGLDPSATSASALATALDHVDRHLDEPIRVPDLARRAGLSPYQLDQRLLGLFGITTAQNITRARIERACGLLRTSEEAISQIAQACGYGDQAAFTRQCRRSVGLTPRACRERHKRAD